MSNESESDLQAPGTGVALAALAAGSLVCSLITLVFAIPALAWTFLWILSALAAIGLAAVMVLRSDARTWSRLLGWALIALGLGLGLLVASG